MQALFLLQNVSDGIGTKFICGLKLLLCMLVRLSYGLRGHCVLNSCIISELYGKVLNFVVLYTTHIFQCQSKENVIFDFKFEKE